MAYDSRVLQRLREIPCPSERREKVVKKRGLRVKAVRQPERKCWDWEVFVPGSATDSEWQWRDSLRRERKKRHCTVVEPFSYSVWPSLRCASE